MKIARRVPFGSAAESAPARDAVEVTDDSVINARALWIGSAGDLVVVFPGATAPVTFKNVPAGTLLPISVESIDDASTASDIVALY